VNTFFRIVREVFECGVFALRLVADLCRRVKRPTTRTRRIALVTRADIFPANHGGAVKIVQTARHLSFHYDEVLVITPSCYDYYVFRDGVPTQQAYPRFASRLFRARPADIEQRIRSTGFPPVDQWMARPLVDRNFRFRVLYLAVQRPFPVMQAEFFPFVFACDWAAKVYPGLSVIAVEHNVEFARIGATYDLSPAAVEMMRKVEIEACQKCDRVVAVSEVDKDQLVGNGVEAARLAVIPLGVDLAEYENRDAAAVGDIRQRHGLRPDDFVIIFHGVLSYKPNQDAVRLLAHEIMPRLRLRGGGVKCLMVGRHPPDEYAHDDIIFTGAVDRLPLYIQSADLAVVPLLEGGGTRLKILEYFAAGVPVISTTKGAEGLRAVPGKEILIEDAMDGIAALVEEMRGDAEKRRTIGENGRHYAQHFGWDRLAVEYCRLYAEIAERNVERYGRAQGTV